MKNSFKSIFSFEFWQKFGKALMVVVAVMPAAGLMISIGKSLPMINPNLGNLHILFALAIGGSWAKERAGGAFAAGLSFILINRITGVMFGVSGEMLKNPEATVRTLLGGTIKVSDYFISVLESPALNMGVFVGLLGQLLTTNTITSVNCRMHFHSLTENVLFHLW